MGKHDKKREASALLSLVLPCVLVAAGGPVAAGSRAVMEGGGVGWSMIPGWECCVPVPGLMGTHPVPFQLVRRQAEE